MGFLQVEFFPGIPCYDGSELSLMQCSEKYFGIFQLMMTCTSPDDLLNNNHQRQHQHYHHHQHDVNNNNNNSSHNASASRVPSCIETSASFEVGKRCPESLQKVIALQQNVGSLAQLDLAKLATLLPPGMSLEQVQQIKMKLSHLNHLQQQQQQQHQQQHK